MNENKFVFKGKTFISEEISEEDRFNINRSICTGCYFNDKDDLCQGIMLEFKKCICDPDDRKDGKNVIFKLFEE